MVHLLYIMNENVTIEKTINEIYELIPLEEFFDSNNTNYKKDIILAKINSILHIFH